VTLVSGRSRLKNLFKRAEASSISDIPSDREVARQGRRRLLTLLFLFDALLIVATLLSFQETELIEERHDLLETRTVYDIEIREQVITNTDVITEIIPYGSLPPE
jgi:hypothetical protein